MGYAIGVLVFILVSLISYVVVALPKVKPADQNAEDRGHAHPPGPRPVPGQPRGRCMDCHSQQRLEGLRAPLHPGTLGKGGDPIFSQANRPAGCHPAQEPHSLRPQALQRRRAGPRHPQRRHQGREAPLPLHALPGLRRDGAGKNLYSIVAYLRTLPEIKNDGAGHKLDPPLNVIVHLIPKDAPDYPKAHDAKTASPHGKYLVRMAGARLPLRRERQA